MPGGVAGAGRVPPAAVASVVVTAACVGCGLCLRTCPERAIRVGARGLVVLPTCTACGECIEICPVDACMEVAR